MAGQPGLPGRRGPANLLASVCSVGGPHCPRPLRRPDELQSDHDASGAWRRGVSVAAIFVGWALIAAGYLLLAPSSVGLLAGAIAISLGPLASLALCDSSLARAQVAAALLLIV